MKIISLTCSKNKAKLKKNIKYKSKIQDKIRYKNQEIIKEKRLNIRSKDLHIEISPNTKLKDYKLANKQKENHTNVQHSSSKHIKAIKY